MASPPIDRPGVPPVVGLIGLGKMGGPIGQHVLRAGFELIVQGRSAAAAAPLVAAGARSASDPGAVAETAGVILLALPDAAAVESVVDALIEGARLAPGTIVVDLSTIAPTDAARLGEAVAAAGGWLLDAPMSGGEAGAIAGSLSLMVGGDEGALEAARPVLDAFATTITHFGPVGAGQVAKACNQLVVMGTLEIVAEALTLAADAGIDPERLRTAMLGGLAQSRVLDIGGRRMLDDDFEPGGRVVLHLKDVDTIRALAARRARSLPAFEAAAAAVTALVAAGGGDLDHASIVQHVRAVGVPADAPTNTFADDATSLRSE